MGILNRILRPRFPAAAIGLERGGAGIVSLEKRRGRLVLRRAGYVAFDETVFRPKFDDVNIFDPGEFTAALADLALRTGLDTQTRWSIALPDAVARVAILTLESAPASRQEFEEMFNWKVERAFGVDPKELRVSRRALRPDPAGRARYLVTGARLSVLSEYEAAFAALGWRAGLILPRHLCEAWWLWRDRGAEGDSLLVSLHERGVTNVLVRAGEPLIVRDIVCELDERADELYRFLLFYRDRVAKDGSGIARLLLVGDDWKDEEKVIEEALERMPRIVGPEDLGLIFPAMEIGFRRLAAPAALASLAWG